MKGQARLAAAVVVAVRIGAATVALGVALLLGDIVNLRTLALEPAANNEGAFVTRATALANSARAYMNTYVPGVIQEVATDRAAAQSVRTTALGKQLVDGIRSQTQHLEQLISARQAGRQRSARESANHAVTVAIVVLIVVTGLTLALSGFLGWLLVGRERARERAAFLAESGASLDRAGTADRTRCGGSGRRTGLTVGRSRA